MKTQRKFPCEVYNTNENNNNKKDDNNNENSKRKISRVDSETLRKIILMKRRKKKKKDVLKLNFSTPSKITCSDLMIKKSSINIIKKPPSLICKPKKVINVCTCQKICDKSCCQIKTNYDLDDEDLINPVLKEKLINCKKLIKKYVMDLLGHKKNLCLSKAFQKVLHEIRCDPKPIKLPGEVIIDKRITRLAFYPSVSLSEYYAMEGEGDFMIDKSTSNTDLLLIKFGNLEQKGDPPVIKDLTNVESFCQLANYLDTVEFETNPVYFWLIYLLSIALKQCQSREMLGINQKIFINWFTYLWNSIQFTTLTRDEIFEDIDDLLRKTSYYMEIADTTIIPSIEYIKELLLETSSLIHSMPQLLNRQTSTLSSSASEAATTTTNEDSSRRDVKSFESKYSEFLEFIEEELSYTGFKSSLCLSVKDSFVLIQEGERIKGSKDSSEETLKDHKLKDLVILATQLYDTFGEEHTFNLLLKLCRRKEIEFYPLNECHKVEIAINT